MVCAGCSTSSAKSVLEWFDSGAGLLHQRVADHDGASEFAGQRLEPARRVYGGADHGEFEPVEADISQHDLPVVQSDTDLDRRLVAAHRVLCSTRQIDADHALAQRKAFSASESPANGVPNVAIKPSPRYLSSVPPCWNTSRSIRSWNCRSVLDDLFRVSPIGVGGESHDIRKQHGHVLRLDPRERFDHFQTIARRRWAKIPREIARASRSDPGAADQERVGTAHRQRQRQWRRSGTRRSSRKRSGMPIDAGLMTSNILMSAPTASRTRADSAA